MLFSLFTLSAAAPLDRVLPQNISQLVVNAAADLSWCTAITNKCVATAGATPWNYDTCVVAAVCTGSDVVAKKLNVAQTTGNFDYNLYAKIVGSCAWANGGCPMTTQNFIDFVYSTISNNGGVYPQAASDVISLWSALGLWAGFTNIPYNNFQDYLKYGKTLTLGSTCGTSSDQWVSNLLNACASKNAAARPYEQASCVAAAMVLGSDKVLSHLACRGDNTPKQSTVVLQYDIYAGMVGACAWQNGGCSMSEQNFIDFIYGQLTAVGSNVYPNSVHSFFSNIATWTGHANVGTIPYDNLQDWFRWAPAVQGAKTQLQKVTQSVNKGVSTVINASHKSKCGWASNNPSWVNPYIASGGSWVYNWSPWPMQIPGLEFVPMFWSSKQAGDFYQNLGNYPAAGVKYIAFLNEPDQPGQANMDPYTAAGQYWQYMSSLRGQYKIVGPALTNAPGSIAWQQQFMQQINWGVDVMALHWYGGSSSNFIDYLNQFHSVFPNYDIWVTEFACSDFSTGGGCTQSQSSFMADVLGFMDATPWVARYAAFGALIDGFSGVNEQCRLLNYDGQSLTDLGHQYFQA